MEPKPIEAVPASVRAYFEDASEAADLSADAFAVAYAEVRPRYPDVCERSLVEHLIYSALDVEVAAAALAAHRTWLQEAAPQIPVTPHIEMLLRTSFRNLGVGKDGRLFTLTNLRSGDFEGDTATRMYIDAALIRNLENVRKVAEGGHMGLNQVIVGVSTGLVYMLPALLQVESALQAQWPLLTHVTYMLVPTWSLRMLCENVIWPLMPQRINSKIRFVSSREEALEVMGLTAEQWPEEAESEAEELPERWETVDNQNINVLWQRCTVAAGDKPALEFQVAAAERAEEAAKWSLAIDDYDLQVIVTFEPSGGVATKDSGGDGDGGTGGAGAGDAGSGGNVSSSGDAGAAAGSSGDGGDDGGGANSDAAGVVLYEGILVEGTPLGGVAGDGRGGILRVSLDNSYSYFRSKGALLSVSQPPQQAETDRAQPAS
eukprot:NODE_5569_length_1756_cov_7.162063.p1 GENE.NODE_5569_length_1756_cov_7.162063~~NODE_5569_length_1756_cov_7.162063.p1  ORF type:complete len:431 (+),score=150.84 NODE_5569_length_1756_cov_7.162063:116-1408(+)